MNFPSVHEGGRKRGERTKAPWSSPSLYIPRSLYFHTPISLPLDRQFHFSIPLSSSRACTNEACNCTGLPCTGEKNIVIRQGLFADRGGGGGEEEGRGLKSNGRSPCSLAFLAPPPLLRGGQITMSMEAADRRCFHREWRDSFPDRATIKRIRREAWAGKQKQVWKVEKKFGCNSVEFFALLNSFLPSGLIKKKKRNSIRKSSEGRT